MHPVVVVNTLSSGRFHKKSTSYSTKVLFLYVIFDKEISCNASGNARDSVKMFNKISMLRNFFSENAYILLFNRSMETRFSFL